MKELCLIQSELRAPKGQFNSFGKYKYRSCEDILEALKPLLSKHGCALVLSDEIVEIGSRVYVKATASLRKSEAYALAVAYAREPEVKKGMDESQVTGAASSYARKYALNGLFAIDDTKDADATNTHDKPLPPAKVEAPSSSANPPPAGGNSPIGKPATSAQARKIYALGQERGISQDDVTALCRWYREGEKMTSQEASYIIEAFDEAYMDYQAAAMETGNQREEASEGIEAKG